MRSTSLRVLTVAHNAVAASNRQRVEALRRVGGLEVELVTPGWWYEEGQRLVAPKSASWRVGRTVFTGNGTRHFYVSGLHNAIRETRPDVIDLFEEPFSAVAFQTVLLRDWLAPSAALLFYSAVNVERQWRWPYRAIERFVLRHADGAHVPNEAVPPILRSRGFGARLVRVIPLGVDVARFSAAQPMPLPTIPPPRIGFVGRFEPVKGLDVLLDAYRRLRVPASLVLVGDGSERRRLVGDGVHLLPTIPFHQVPSLLKALDVLVLPSVTILPLHREQFGRVLAEAMAAGVAVVGSNSGAIPEVIGDAGIVVPERDPLALAGAIEQLLTDRALRQRLVERGTQRAMAHFDWSAVAQQTVDLFQTAVADRRGLKSLAAVGV